MLFMRWLPFLVALGSVIKSSKLNKEFRLQAEFEQLKYIYGNDDPEAVDILKALEKPRNWDALMRTTDHLPSKYSAELSATLLGLRETIIPCRGKKMKEEEGKDMQAVLETGVAIQEGFFRALGDGAQAEEIAGHLVRWLLHLKKYESFWIRRKYNVPRLENTLKHLVRRMVGLYGEVVAVEEGADAEAEVVRAVLEELDGQIGQRWEWQWIVLIGFISLGLLLLLLSLFVFCLRFRRRKK